MLQSPNELGPRAALLQHYNVVKQHTEQSKSRVSCKGCSHTFAGKTTRMAAHYMQTAGENKTRLHGSCASFSHTVVETQVSSKKGLCVQQREVNDAAMVLHSVYKARMFM